MERMPPPPRALSSFCQPLSPVLGSWPGADTSRPRRLPAWLAGRGIGFGGGSGAVPRHAQAQMGGATRMLREDDGFRRPAAGSQGHVTSLSSRDTHGFRVFFLLSRFDPFRSGCCRGATTEEEDEDEAAPADADTDGTATARRRVQRVLDLLPTPRARRALFVVAVHLCWLKNGAWRAACDEPYLAWTLTLLLPDLVCIEGEWRPHAAGLYKFTYRIADEDGWAV